MSKYILDVDNPETEHELAIAPGDASRELWPAPRLR